MRVLVVEDEKKMAETLKRGLEDEGYAVDVVHDGARAKARIEGLHEEYDLIVLDLMLPGMEGREVARTVREQRIQTPILMLTALGSVEDKVEGLDSGADDYLVKPFSFAELSARARTLLRRPREALPPTLQVADLTLDTGTRSVSRAGREVELTSKEYGLLEYFMRNPGRLLSRDDILAHVWDWEFDAASNVLEVHVSRLRKKIDEGHKIHLLHTVRGAGYVLKA